MERHHSLNRLESAHVVPGEKAMATLRSCSIQAVKRLSSGSSDGRYKIYFGEQLFERIVVASFKV